MYWILSLTLDDQGEGTGRGNISIDGKMKGWMGGKSFRLGLLSLRGGSFGGGHDDGGSMMSFTGFSKFQILFFSPSLRFPLPLPFPLPPRPQKNRKGKKKPTTLPTPCGLLSPPWPGGILSSPVEESKGQRPLSSYTPPSLLCRATIVGLRGLNEIKDGYNYVKFLR